MASPGSRLSVVARVGGAASLALAALAFVHTPAQAAVHRAALVVVHGTAWSGPRILWRCVQFTQDAISGLSLLELAGVNSGQPPQVYDWGGGAATVCQLGGEPRQVPDRCFGPTSGPNWSDWRWSSAGWVSRSSGVTGYTVRDGDLEGWTYSGGFGSPPQATTFARVCATVASPPTRGGATARAAPATATAQSMPSASRVTAAVPSASSEASVLPDTAASATPMAAKPGSASGTTAYLVFGASALLLLGLAGWNLLRRSP